MDMFDFEELLADMLDISDEQREDDDYIMDRFFDKFDMDIEQGYRFAVALLKHTPKVEARLSGKTYHAFISKNHPVMLMKIEAKPET